jgi:hypothetical protein
MEALKMVAIQLTDGDFNSANFYIMRSECGNLCY